MSLLSCQIFFHWKESPGAGILVFIIITFFFLKRKKKKPERHFLQCNKLPDVSHVSQWFTSHSPWHNFSEFHGGGDKTIFSFILCKSRIRNICTRKIIHHHSHRLPLWETGKEETLHPSWINKSTLKFVSVSEAVQLNEKYIIILIIHYTVHVLSSVVTADSLLLFSFLSWC